MFPTGDTCTCSYWLLLLLLLLLLFMLFMFLLSFHDCDQRINQILGRLQEIDTRDKHKHDNDSFLCSVRLAETDILIGAARSKGK